MRVCQALMRPAVNNNASHRTLPRVGFEQGKLWTVTGGSLGLSGKARTIPGRPTPLINSVVKLYVHKPSKIPNQSILACLQVWRVFILTGWGR